MSENEDMSASSRINETIKLEKTSIGVSAAGAIISAIMGLLLTLLLLGVSEMRATIGSLSTDVRLALRDIAVLQTQATTIGRLEERLRNLENDVAATRRGDRNDRNDTRPGDR